MLTLLYSVRLISIGMITGILHLRARSYFCLPSEKISFFNSLLPKDDDGNDKDFDRDITLTYSFEVTSFVAYFLLCS